MTAPLFEQFVNDATTTLSSAANTSTTSLSVTSGTVFPSVGNFRVKVDDEIMLCTARSSNTLTVIRGQEGTAAASHTNTTSISSVLTAAALTTTGHDSTLGWRAGLPMGKIVQDDGITAIPAASWTAINSGHTNFFSDEDGCIVAQLDSSSGNNWRSWTPTSYTLPSTPYEYVARWDKLHPIFNGPNMALGLGLRESATSKHGFAVYYESTSQPEGHVSAMEDASDTNFAGNGSSQFVLADNGVWLKIKNDGTNIIYSFSIDGKYFSTSRSVAKTSIFTTAPDQICVTLHCNGGDTTNTFRLSHFSRTL